MADGVDQPCDPPEAVQSAAGQIGDVGDAAKRHQVVRADAVNGDAANDHHVVARVVETVAENARRVEVVTAEQAFLPEFANALRGTPHVLDVRRDAAGGEQVADRLLESWGVERIAARDADAGCGVWWMLVLCFVGHRRLLGQKVMGR